MRKQILRILAAVIALSMMIWLMSCTNPPQNTNQSTASSNAANTANKEGEESQYKGGCGKVDIETAMNNILSGTDPKIDHVADQFNGKNIQFGVYTDEEGQYVIVIAGGVSDGKPGENSKNLEIMENVIKAVDQLVLKSCAFKAVFVSRDEFKSLTENQITLRQIKGFDWSSCEWPDIACPGGQCKPTCDGSVANSNANKGSNANASSNANSNSNANANANRP